MKLTIPGVGERDWNNAAFDLNGTITQYGIIQAGTGELLSKLRSAGFGQLLLLTGDTRGDGAVVAAKLKLELVRCQDGDEKAHAIREHGDPSTFVVVGNGNIDIPMFELMRASDGLAIGIRGREGAYSDALRMAHLQFNDVRDAIRALLSPDVLIADLRR